MSDPAWEAKFAQFLERVMAVYVAGGDPRPLREELKALVASAPPARRAELEGMKETTDGPRTTGTKAGRAGR